MKTSRLLAALLLGACSALPTTTASPDYQPNEVVSATRDTTTTTTTVVATTSTTPAATTSTTEPFVDLADPFRIYSQALEIDLPVSTESCKSDALDPCPGTSLWVPVGNRQAGPCELGLVLMLGHVNKHEAFYNLVDDSPNDYTHDHGVEPGDTVNFELADHTTCRYEVIEPLGAEIQGVMKIDGQPAVYFLKDPVVMNPIINELIKRVGDQPVLMMAVSYGGPDGNEYIPGTKHRAYNAVVFARLLAPEEG